MEKQVHSNRVRRSGTVQLAVPFSKLPLYCTPAHYSSFSSLDVE